VILPVILVPMYLVSADACGPVLPYPFSQVSGVLMPSGASAGIPCPERSSPPSDTDHLPKLQVLGLLSHARGSSLGGR
jgi:hypothetical protein